MRRFATGARAVELARRACEIDGSRRHNYVGTLAAAFAETGEFERAARYAKRAAELAEGVGQTAAAEQHRLRAKQYAEEKPYREE